MVQHCNDEDLALMALGEAVASADLAHLQQCARCQSQLDQLTAVVASTRSVTPADLPSAPPDEVWHAISAELSLGSSDSNVASIDRARGKRRRVSGWMIAAAAVAGIAVGSAATIGLLSSGTRSQVLALATLDPIDDSGATGTAKVESSDGSSVLVVSIPNLPSEADGYYEVWMATPDTSKMVAMGALDSRHEGRFVLPSGMDMDSYPVVDVSLEHFDGDNGHSATSLARGSLAF